ncbi:LPS assembly lipoprotein LptE [Methylophilaceae bacterium]|jgi:LPS-assembly lipoprotein|nr:LPS assembly lipoprotein LptE [Methylophilaceae bacterium]|tara:strand:+ start:52 stop:525 length:474 start_codon:yes stop_codon:yes gene_type:complete
MKAVLKKIFILILTFSIMSCGFQLRGSLENSFSSIQIDGGSSSFTNELKKKYKQSGIQIKNSSAEKSIEIITDQFDKRILSLSSTGKIREYRLNYLISYRIKNSLGDWGPVIKINSTREYSYDDNNIVAKQEEEKNLIQGMKEQIFRTMRSQISSSK